MIYQEDKIPTFYNLKELREKTFHEIPEIALEINKDMKELNTKSPYIWKE